VLAAFLDRREGVLCVVGRRDGSLEYVSPSTAAALGRAVTGTAAPTLWDVVAHQERRELEALLAARKPVDGVAVEFVDEDGVTIHAECTLAFAGRRFVLLCDGPTRAAAGREAEVLGLNDELVVQVREGMRLARELEHSVHELEGALGASADELRAAFRRVTRARDEERRRILRDLHDGAQQQLLAVGVGLDVAAAEPSASPELRQRLLALRDKLDDALVTLRDLGSGIYPAALADHGIVEGLRTTTADSSPPIEVRGSHLGRYPAEIEGAVYFACLEGVQNALKHAEATRIVVEVAERDDTLVFSVRDDGSGFAPSGQRVGAGLRNISDRLRAAGGRLRVSSSRGGGTTLSGEVPLPARGRT
jgi:signal transduction histidine kinase